MKTIEVQAVSKQYKQTKALDKISVTFECGKIYGLLGRNGAGKSTLINIINNRIFPNEGQVTIDNESNINNMKIQELLYSMSEKDLYPNQKVCDIFKWTNRFYDCFDMDKAISLSKRFELDTSKKIFSLSTGYKSICKLIIALSLRVPYVIFDEPVLGLDANHREMFYKMLLEDYETNQRTIIIATHLIEEIANIIEEVVIIDKGRLLLQGSVEEIMAKGYSVAGAPSVVDQYCIDETVLDFEEVAGMKVVYIVGEIRQEKQIAGLHFSSMNLQKIFVKLTQGGNDDEIENIN